MPISLGCARLSPSTSLGTNGVWGSITSPGLKGGADKISGCQASVTSAQIGKWSDALRADAL